MLILVNFNNLNAISKFGMENDCTAQKMVQGTKPIGDTWGFCICKLVFILLGLVVVYNLENSITFYRDAYSYFGQTLIFKIVECKYLPSLSALMFT